eukprot:5418803-Pleurochrysis_carterae.AAC.5
MAKFEAFPPCAICIDSPWILFLVASLVQITMWHNVDSLVSKCEKGHQKRLKIVAGIPHLLTACSSCWDRLGTLKSVG